MIAIIDYGAGNLRSQENTFAALGVAAKICSSPKEIAKAAGIVIPGVGSFATGMEGLRRSGLLDALQEAVHVQKKPCLGVCLGMQLLADSGHEDGEYRGLGWFPGIVKYIEPVKPEFRVPHMGWNEVHVRLRSPLFEGMGEHPIFYFVHSYSFRPEIGSEDCVSATCEHGTEIVAAIQRDNIFGVQFHPEKSQEDGLILLKNFLRLL